MKKAQYFALLLTAGVLLNEDVEAHSHTTYIVEQPVIVRPAPTYVVAAPVAPVSVVEVESEPPSDVEEEMIPSPGANYCWIKGHWQWDGQRWVRVHGHWEVRPSATAMWVPGFWTKHHHHWRWTDGYWQ